MKLPDFPLSAVLFGIAIGVSHAATLRELLAGPPPDIRVYKTVGGTPLHAAVYPPVAAPSGPRRPAVVWIHGGSWVGGTPDGFVPHARYFSWRGAVCFNLEYRLVRPGGPGIGDCIADCKSAIRYVRSHAAEWGIDPHRIAVAGDSAGGHLAAALATLDGFDDPADDLSLSARPDALLLFNPVLDLTEDDWPRYAVGGQALADKKAPRPSSPEAEKIARDLSPLFHVRPGMPPTLLMHGREDVIVRWSQARRMADAAKAVGSRCDLILLEGTGHAFVVAYYKSPEAKVVDVLCSADRFLGSLGWLGGSPDLEPSTPPVWQPLKPAGPIVPGK